jgi:recombinational DNA repair protein RecR
VRPGGTDLVGLRGCERDCSLGWADCHICTICGDQSRRGEALSVIWKQELHVQIAKPPFCTGNVHSLRGLQQPIEMMPRVHTSEQNSNMNAYV